MEWKNKIVWIVGASSGIGAALARQLMAEGAKVILSARNTEKLHELQNAIDPDHQETSVLAMDIAELHKANDVSAQALAAFGDLDVVVLNAGITQRSLAVDTVLTVDEHLMAVNYLGPVAIAKALLPHFRKRKSGSIAVTSSVAGRIGTPLRSAYCASKHALHGFFESLRAEEYEHGIHVCIICPGFIKTDISLHALTGDGSVYDRRDPGQEAGIPVDQCARKYLSAVSKGREFVLISGPRERFAVWMGRFFPNLLRRMIRRMKVT